jgi:hypothetical protein
MPATAHLPLVLGVLQLWCKNAVTSPPSQDENHRAASHHEGARPELCCALMDERSTEQDPVGEDSRFIRSV